MAMARSCGKVALGCVLALAWLSMAPATSAAPLCETQTQRPPSDIVVPLGDADNPELPPTAIKLLPGETLCVTGELDSAGELVRLRLLTAGEKSVAPVVELRFERAASAQLSVRHLSGKWLFYRAARLTTAQNLALGTHTANVAPGQTAMEHWGLNVRTLLLYSLRFGDEPMSLSEILRGRRTRDTEKTNVSVTLGAWGGERALHLENLDRALGRDGFAPLPRVVIAGGVDADFTLGRARVGFTFGVSGQTTRQHANGKELTTWLPEWAFTAGFAVLRYQQLHVFLSTGIGVANLHVDRPAGSSVFPDVRAGEADRVQFVALEAPLDVGAEYFVPFARASPSEKWLLQFGVRLGWQAQLGSGFWQTAAKEGREIAGPAVNLSGPRARLILGIGAQNGW